VLWLSQHKGKLPAIEADNEAKAKTGLDIATVVGANHISVLFCQVLIAVHDSEEKIDKIEGKLNQIVDLIDALRQGFSVSPKSDNSSMRFVCPESTAPPSAPQIGYMDNTAHRAPGNSRVVETSDDPTRNMAVVEGHSSFTAHSVFGLDFIQSIVRSSQNAQECNDMSELLSTLRHMVALFKNQRSSSKNRLPFAQLKPTASIKNLEMPPLQTTFAIIQHAQGSSLLCYQI
jgi:hypothetical protein